MPLLARIFLVQTILFSVFIQENKVKTKAIGKDSSSRKEKKKGKICWKIKVFGKDWTNLAKGLWSRSLLRQKRRPWSSFPMTQGLQNYYIAWFIQLRKDKRNCPEEDKSNLLKQYCYSNSTVAGGLEVTSYSTRLMWGTSPTMRPLTLSSRSQGRRDQVAVMKSWVCTDRNAMA